QPYYSAVPECECEPLPLYAATDSRPTVATPPLFAAIAFSSGSGLRLMVLRAPWLTILLEMCNVRSSTGHSSRSELRLQYHAHQTAYSTRLYA
ncbi:hypothetical protein PENTCL1PPCAC_3690, partial [Pristionchus entomophagus]